MKKLIIRKKGDKKKKEGKEYDEFGNKIVEKNPSLNQKPFWMEKMEKLTKEINVSHTKKFDHDNKIIDHNTGHNIHDKLTSLDFRTFKK